MTNQIINILPVFRETYRLLKNHFGAFFTVFVLETFFFAILITASFLAIKFPEIRNSFENRFTAKVFLKENASDKEIRNFISELKKDNKIKVKLITQEEAAELFAKKIDVEVTDLLKEISFPVSVTIKFNSGFSYAGILSYLNKLKKNKLVESVKYPKKTAYYLSKHILIFSILLLGSILLLLWGLFSMIKQFANKIVELTKEENKIKALIGVKHRYIKMPYTLSGFVITFLALTFVLMAYVAVIQITYGNIFFEKSLFFPIIIILIFSFVLVKKHSITTL